MKIAVWRTKHEIATTIANAVLDGLEASGNPAVIYLDADEMVDEDIDLHIGYGILRGMDDVFRACQKAGKPFILLDKGYWKPGHYDGYYRVSLNGTQQSIGLDKLEPDYARWDALGIEILPIKEHEGEILVCPPTDPVQHFFMPGMDDWINCDGYVENWNCIVRNKGDPLPIKWNNIKRVITFNSSVGWEALRQGIPVVSNAEHSIVGAYQKLIDKPLYTDLDERRRLFGIMAGLQMTLPEIASGKLWPLIQTLLSL